jgi:hypothetical protein
MSTHLLPPVTMPQLSGGRDRARTLALPLAGKMQGQRVQLDCRQLVAGTASFADEIVKRVLVEGGASLLVVEYVAGDFANYLIDAARDHGVPEKIDII